MSNNCGTKCVSESSSSSGSEVCHRVKCEPKCSEKSCCVDECPDLGGCKIGCKFGNAVVQVTSEFILLGAGVTGAGVSGTVGSPTGTTPLGFNTRVDLQVGGNGFFVKGHYIVCPAHLVLLPPQVSSVAVRYPFQSVNHQQGIPIPNQMTRASRILVSVADVNNKGHGFEYEAQLIGVDGAGDIAVLKIYQASSFNATNPCIQKCHPYLELGQSRAACDGSNVYALTNGINQTVTAASLADHRYVDVQGLALAEMILMAQPLYQFASGAPVVNGQGQVLGFLTAPVGSSTPTGFFQMGPSEFFFARVVKTLIKASCSRQRCCSQTETICDPAGAYLRYLKGYLGVAYQVFQGEDYDVTTDFTSAGPGAFNGQPRVRLTSAGGFMGSPLCKQIIGVQVLGLAGGNTGDSTSSVLNGYWYVPGGTAASGSYLASPLPVSGFLTAVQPGDLITHLNRVALGDQEKQVAPSLITWRLKPGDLVQVTYRQGGNALNTADNSLTLNYDGLVTAETCVGMMPYVLDYPYYAESQFPALSSTVYPGFSNPNGLTLNTGPALLAGAPFHPAI